MAAIAERTDSSALSDEQVVERVLAGDRALYEILVRRHNQKVYRTVRAVLRDDAEAEDVMQHAYVAAYTHLPQFRRDARFATWLVRIAVNEALARLRLKGRFAAELESERAEVAGESTMPKAHDPEQQTAARELGEVLQALIEQLPLEPRTVFVLRAIEGMSTAEVAQALELSEDNVKTRLHRAKSALREAVTKQLGDAAMHVWRFDAVRCDAVARAVMDRIGAPDA